MYAGDGAIGEAWTAPGDDLPGPASPSGLGDKSEGLSAPLSDLARAAAGAEPGSAQMAATPNVSPRIGAALPVQGAGASAPAPTGPVPSGDEGAAPLPAEGAPGAGEDGQEPATQMIAQRVGLRDGWKLSEDGRIEMRPGTARMSAVQAASGGATAGAMNGARSGAASAAAPDSQTGPQAGPPAQGAPGFVDALAQASARAAPMPAASAEAAPAGQGAFSAMTSGVASGAAGGGAGSADTQASDKSAPARATALNAQTLALVSARFIQTLQGRATRFDMTLTPESLGRVDVKMSVDGDGRVAARLAFDNPLAMTDFRGRADELRRELEAAGFTLSDEGFEFTERERREALPLWERHDAPGRAPNPETETVTPARWLALGPAREGVDVRI
ncbi:MAG: flagellar hook-length control protein FliK [Brevundimonas sp.]|uniref:flagellar hook-length control protein FliK n=1 Tax=Brevundimonas sp. TaxID=1871086 RepID=UPI0039190310